MEKDMEKEENFVMFFFSFEGNYLNGKKNGEGKEYHPLFGHMIYEGSYLDEKENGNGKSYYLNNGKLRYVGEFLLGQFHGEGKEYDANGNLIFEGEYLYGYIWNRKGKNIIIIIN